MGGRVVRRVVLVVLLLAGTVSAASAEAQSAPPWTVTVLQPLVAGQATMVFDVNDSGQSVGWSNSQPVRWDASGTPTALAYPYDGCTSGAANAIADSGAAVGVVQCPGKQNLGVWWMPNGTPVPIATGIGPTDVTDSGLVVGDRFGTTSFDDTTGFAWVNGQAPVALAKPSGVAAHVTATTSYGYVVGALQEEPGLGQPKTAAVGWFGQYAFPLLLTSTPTYGIDVIESGYALVGLYPTSGTGDRGYLVAPRGGVTALDHPGLNDDVYDMNQYGVVVGQSEPTAGTFEGRFYFPQGSIRMADLVSPADASNYVLDNPTALNDSAWVVGWTNPDHSVAWLLKPPTGS